MNTSGQIGLYLEFRKQWISKFINTLLPKGFSKQEFNKDFDEVMCLFYEKYLLKKYDYIDELQEFENHDEIELWFQNHSIEDEMMKLLFLNFVDSNVFSETIDYYKYFLYVSTIKISLEFDKYIDFNGTKKETYFKVRKEVLQKFTNIPDEILELLKEKNTKLNALFNKVVKSNYNFLNNINKSKVFSIVKHKIVAKEEDIPMYYLSISYKLPDLKKFNIKDVEHMKDNNVIINNLKKIEIETSSFNTFIKLCNGESEKVFINVSDFINKVNTKYLIKTLDHIKDNIILIVNYDLLNKYRDLINELKSDDYQICFEKGLDPLDSKKLYKIPYVIIKYEKSMEYEKAIAEVKLSKAKTILSEINEDDFLRSNANYCLENVKIC